MADSVITALVITTLLLNFLAIGAYWKQISHGYASLNAIGWGAVPDSKDPADDDHNNITENTDEEDAPLPRRKSLIEENTIPAENTDGDQNTNMYGRAQEEYDGYISAYTTCWRKPKPVVMQSCAEQDNSIDSRNVMMAQQRARDKRCMDGALKDANFYRHHYAEELTESENKPWWGVGEV